MSNDENVKAPRLWSKEGFLDDEWVRAETAAADQRVILSLETYLELGDADRQNAEDRIGVELQPGDELDLIVPYLDQLPLIALAFPAFSDGRSFSKAQLLRNRYKYQGAIRATGDVLIDQIPHMLRTGIDEFEVSNETALIRLDEGRIGGISQYYQPAAASSRSAGSYTWRRLPA